MAITVNEIYNYIEAAVNTTERPVYCASVVEPISAQFPACQIVEIDHPVHQRALPLSFAHKTAVTVRRDFEVHVFSNLKNRALSEARSIMEDVEIAFRQLSFIETMCRQTDNVDATVIHLVARFTRIVADGDELETD